VIPILTFSFHFSLSFNTLGFDFEQRTAVCLKSVSPPHRPFVLDPSTSLPFLTVQYRVCPARRPLTRTPPPFPCRFPPYCGRGVFSPRPYPDVPFSRIGRVRCSCIRSKAVLPFEVCVFPFFQRTAKHTCSSDSGFTLASHLLVTKPCNC